MHKMGRGDWLACAYEWKSTKAAMLCKGCLRKKSAIAWTYEEEPLSKIR
jgi:hypothetical protein